MIKYTKDELLAFIAGVQECTENGDIIEKYKLLQWEVIDSNDYWFIKAVWICEIIKGSGDNPETSIDDKNIWNSYYFKIGKNNSLRKLCAEICDAIDVVNKNEINII